ncbi:MAG: hypothetical protein K2X47_15170 [Bdellovibrionales bacterium]|nr:hypothetical protein [Bdellovibrionales bacterium]
MRHFGSSRRGIAAAVLMIGLLAAELVLAAEGKRVSQTPYPQAFQAQLIQNQLASNSVHELKNPKRTRQQIESELASLKSEQGQSIFRNPRMLAELFRRERRLRAELKQLGSQSKNIGAR